jgi:type IV pilus assembly protein PilY1
LSAAVAMAFLAMPALSLAAATDLSQTPIASSSSGVVKPNINFILDRSGSMASLHAPDEASPFDDRYGYKSSHCNSIYYDPTINYAVPKNYDGTDFPAATFTNAWDDGYNVSNGTTNLSSKFQANSGDNSQAAYYYKYSGSQTANFLNTTNLFYRECNSSVGSNPGSGVFTKVVVSSTSGPGSTDERQNFANWYSYYRSRMLMMKSGTGRAFSTIGSNYRIGFMTLFTVPSNSTTDPLYLKISDFDATQKQAWYKKLYDVDPSGNTPLKAALATAGRNYAGKIGPDPVQYSCQQNFTILTTDGYWNSGTPAGDDLNGNDIGNIDNNAGNWPRPMYDGGGSGTSGTLADVAAYYYSTDLRSGPTCNTGVSGADVCTDNVATSEADKNPKQHMTTFTVGLGVNGRLGYTDDYLKGTSADYNAISQGPANWPKPVGDTLTTIDDLWHAAVNGHGQYFSAKNPNTLVSGLRQALAGVSARDAAGAAAATSNLEPTPGDNFAYVANYRTQKWDGDVEARTIDLSTGSVSTTAVWSAQALLDTKVDDTTDTRTIFTVVGGVKKDFVAASFSAAQLSSWFTPGNAPALTQFASWTPLQLLAATPDSMIKYLRGQFGFEQRAANTLPLYRQRDHVLGDIVNGKPVYVRIPPFYYNDPYYGSFKSGLSGRTGMVYAAANDGMVHAFDSATGVEKWAYIPSFVLPNLKALADENYANAHQFYADGSPVAADICTSAPCAAVNNWKTILVGGLNAGGKGYYALDVTNPASPNVLWEFSHANMGYTYGLPVIAKLKDGKWYVFVTSGYNNTSGTGAGHLFVIEAATGVLKYTLNTGVGDATTPSGLAKISAWVDDGLTDNTVLRLYGGDLLGNLWRFDPNDIYPPAGRDAVKLASFMVSSVPQPITTKPELGLVRGYATPTTSYPVVFVGTGRYLGSSDVLNTTQQSVYAIKDPLDAAGVGDVRNSPVASCTGTNKFVKQSLVVSGTDTFTVTNNPVDFGINCGWYLDFSAAPNPAGERVNVDPKLQLGVLAVATNIPEKSICTVGGTSWLYFFDYRGYSGSLENPPAVVGQKIGNSIAVGINTYKLPDGRVVSTVTTSDDKHPVFANPDLGLIGASTKRVLWRELLN